MFPMTIRQADPSDQNDINRIYACARALMKADGNPNQRGDKKPYPDVLRFDIEKNRLYIVENEGRAVGCFAFYEGPDPTYNYIENGSWSKDGPYHVIHRVASDGSVKGVMNTILAFCFSKASYLRMDTHDDNHRMQHILLSHGFRRCGTIYLEDGNKRISFDRVVLPSGQVTFDA